MSYLNIDSSTPKIKLQHLLEYYTREKDVASRELSELLVANERKFDGEVFREDLWETYTYLTDRFVECSEIIRKITFLINKPSVEYTK
jgi:hypothetical protein